MFFNLLSDIEHNFENLEVANKAGAGNRLWILQYFHLQLYVLAKTFNEITGTQSIYQYEKAMKKLLSKTEYHCKLYSVKLKKHGLLKPFNRDGVSRLGRRNTFSW